MIQYKKAIWHLAIWQNSCFGQFIIQELKFCKITQFFVTVSVLRENLRENKYQTHIPHTADDDDDDDRPTTAMRRPYQKSLEKRAVSKNGACVLRLHEPATAAIRPLAVAPLLLRARYYPAHACRPCRGGRGGGSMAVGRQQRAPRQRSRQRQHLAALHLVLRGLE